MVLISSSCFFQVDTTVQLKPGNEDRSVLMDLGFSVWSLLEDDSLAGGVPSNEGPMPEREPPVKIAPEFPDRVKLLKHSADQKQYQNGLSRESQRMLLLMEPGTEVEPAKILSLTDEMEPGVADLFQFPSFRNGQDSFEILFPPGSTASDGGGGFESAMLSAMLAGAVTVRFMVDHRFPVREATLIHLDGEGEAKGEAIPMDGIPGGVMVQVPSILLGMAYSQGSILVIHYGTGPIQMDRYAGMLHAMHPDQQKTGTDASDPDLI